MKRERVKEKVVVVMVEDEEKKTGVFGKNLKKVSPRTRVEH